jgi:hypothetical protein
MIEQLVYSDAESNRLLTEMNFRNETPEMLVDKQKYSYIFNHIWYYASLQGNSYVDQLDEILK